MKFNTRSILATGALVAGTASASNLTSVTVSGNAFYTGSDRFYIRGVDYQPGGSSAESDPLTSASGCARDIPYFQQLGINTIRVYTVDNSQNHDACMNALSAAGIYVVLDTDNSFYSLNRDDPAESYNAEYLQSVFATVDAFADYNNTLAFLSGNEVINAANNTNCAPYVKAVTRDMKEYISARGYRQIPVGYSAADVAQNQQLMAEYMNCGSDAVRSDFYAINDYSWCDPSSFTESGWNTLVDNYTGYGIPLFMSEFGCITNTRTFQEISAMYNTEMTNVFSGGLVYSYSQEGNGYGLVTISGNTVTDYNNQLTLLETAYKNTPNPTGSGGASSTSSASQCPPSSADWDVSSDAIPDTPSAALKYFHDGAGTGPGLTDPGSQSDGDGSSASATVTGSVASPTGSSTSSGSASSSGTSSSAAMSYLHGLEKLPFVVGMAAVTCTLVFQALL